jgi:diguanylate cyclase (GGDEF)-like protein
MEKIEKPKILIIDDEINILKALKRELKALYNVEIFQDPYKAIESIGSVQYHVVISDFSMPIMSGIDFLRKIKLISPLSKRIILTGQADLNIAVRCINESNIFKLLLKPWDKDTLKQTLEESINDYEVIRNIKLKSEFDSLTEIFNRGTGVDKLKFEVERSKRYNTPLSLLMFDLDHFKNINDRYGHHIGDEVLKEVSAYVSSTIRKSDIFFRYGGEEFIVIFSNLGLEMAIEISNRLREGISKLSFSIEGLKISISGGVSQYSLNSYTDMINEADEKLYKAKSSGRDRIF